MPKSANQLPVCSFARQLPTVAQRPAPHNSDHEALVQQYMSQMRSGSATSSTSPRLAQGPTTSDYEAKLALFMSLKGNEGKLPIKSLSPPATTQDVRLAHQCRSSSGASPEQLLEKTDEEINRLTLEMNHALRRRQEHERRIQALHGQPTPPLQHASPQQQKQPAIKPGSIVELYSDTSYFAIPAIVLEGSSSSNNEYVIENTITHDTLPSVSSKLIHPYQIYADGTRASCNIGIEDTVYMTPCAVRSHVVREKSGLAMYEVSYLENDKLVEEYMPFSRVQRIHGRRNGMRGTAARSTSAQ